MDSYNPIPYCENPQRFRIKKDNVESIKDFYLAKFRLKIDDGSKKWAKDQEIKVIEDQGECLNFHKDYQTKLQRDSKKGKNDKKSHDLSKYSTEDRDFFIGENQKELNSLLNRHPDSQKIKEAISDKYSFFFSSHRDDYSEDDFNNFLASLKERLKSYYSRKDQKDDKFDNVNYIQTSSTVNQFDVQKNSNSKTTVCNKKEQVLSDTKLSMTKLGEKNTADLQNKNNLSLATTVVQKTEPVVSSQAVYSAKNIHNSCTLFNSKSVLASHPKESSSPIKSLEVILLYSAPIIFLGLAGFALGGLPGMAVGMAAGLLISESLTSVENKPHSMFLYP